MKCELIQELAKRYKCNGSDILVTSAVAKGYVPIVKSCNEERIYDNDKALKIKLKKEAVIKSELDLSENQSTISSGAESYAYLYLKK